MTSGWGGDDLALRVRELRAKVRELEGLTELTWREKTALEARAAAAEERIAALEDGLRDALNRIHALEDQQPDYADPEEPEEEPPVVEYDPGPEVDDEGGMSEYRYILPEEYQRGQS